MSIVELYFNQLWDAARTLKLLNILFCDFCDFLVILDDFKRIFCLLTRKHIWKNSVFDTFATPNAVDFSCFQKKIKELVEHWWKHTKKVLQPAIRCRQHPKAGKNTQQRTMENLSILSLVGAGAKTGLSFSRIDHKCQNQLITIAYWRHFFGRYLPNLFMVELIRFAHR